jgi:hypothetical protein
MVEEPSLQQRIKESLRGEWYEGSFTIILQDVIIFVKNKERILEQVIVIVKNVQYKNDRIIFVIVSFLSSIAVYSLECS